MGTMKVVDILKRANTILHDATKVRWPMTELLDWYNDAQRAIVVRRPDASPADAAFSCVLGTRQQLPSDGLRLLDVMRNEAAGTAITVIDRKELDENIRGWHDASHPTTDVQHYVYDDRNPKIFYLYPAPPDSHQVRICYSTALDDVAITDFDADNQAIALDDVYCNPLIDWILYRAFSKDSEINQTDMQAKNALAVFENALGVKTQVDSTVSPNA